MILKWLLLSFIILTSAFAMDDRFPKPSDKSVKMFAEIVHKLGMNEVFSLSPEAMAEFVYNYKVCGPAEDFSFYGSNPAELCSEQVKYPATILIHASRSNQGQWLPLLADLEEYQLAKNLSGPVFTYNYGEEAKQQDLNALIEQIQAIRKLYEDAGFEGNIPLNLVGHSLGGICAAEYAFSPELWIQGTSVNKVIAIATRLKNVDPPTSTPFYPYSYGVLPRIDEIWNKIELHNDLSQKLLYTVVAEKDWLLPLESALAERDEHHSAIIPDKGHGLVPYAKATREVVIKWLFE